MALLKTFEINSSGITADYLKISSVNVTRLEGKEVLHIECEVYKDQASRDTGKNPITNLTYRTEDLTLLNQIIALLYGNLKTLPEFNGALDI